MSLCFVSRNLTKKGTGKANRRNAPVDFFDFDKDLVLVFADLPISISEFGYESALDKSNSVLFCNGCKAAIKASSIKYKTVYRDNKRHLNKIAELCP